MTKNIEILDELQPFIKQLLDIAGKSNSFWVLAETYTLQAKLALLTLDLERARKLLTQAQSLADKHGMYRLAAKISAEHDKLLKELTLWENLKKSNAPLSERLELARLNEQMEVMLRKRAFIPPKIEAEKPILLTIMTEYSEPILFNHFTADMTIDDTHLGEFLSSCHTYCGQIFSEMFDRVKFGQYTILINTVDSFSICYLFQGQTYSAQQKLKHFSKAINKDTRIIEILKSASNKRKVIEVNDNPSIEELIIESFISDPKQFQAPFKAYVGDDTYVFASYVHADKLKVYPIIDYLNKMGINIWYDEGIPVSENWKKSIAVNLERSKVFLVFISPHIIDSEYVRKEISFALKKHKPFFAIYLKETKLPTELEFEIADIQAMMKYLMPETEFYNKLKELLYHSLND